MGGEEQLNKYAGKTRIGLITMLGVAALAIAGLHRSSARAYGGSLTPTIPVYGRLLRRRDGLFGCEQRRRFAAGAGAHGPFQSAICGR